MVVLGGDFRQILPVVRKGRRADIVYSTINRSYLWRECLVFKLNTNMRLLHNKLTTSEYVSMKKFSEWILEIGNGELGGGDGESLITIPLDLIIKLTENPMEDIIRSTNPDLQINLTDHSYLQERAILAPTNEVVEELNDYIISCLPGEEQTYFSEHQLDEVEKFVRLHYDLDINVEGIEAISHLLEKIKDMQDRNMQLQNRLSLYENNNEE